MSNTDDRLVKIREGRVFMLTFILYRTAPLQRNIQRFFEINFAKFTNIEVERFANLWMTAWFKSWIVAFSIVLIVALLIELFDGKLVVGATR